MRLRLPICLIGLACVLLSPRAEAGWGALASVPRLCANADAVIIGPVEAVIVSGTVNATITAERVLKGDLTEGSFVSFNWTRPAGQVMPTAPNRPVVRTQGHGIFFLKQNGPTLWALLPGTVGAADWENTYIHIPMNVPGVIRERVFASAPTRPSVLDAVILEVLTAMEAGAWMPADLIGIFRESRSPLLAAAFSRMLSSEDPRRVVYGVRGSVLSGDKAVISLIRQKRATLSGVPGWSELLDTLKTEYVNTTPQAIQDLGQVAVDEGDALDFRIATAAVLARMHTQETLPYPGKLLSDKNVALKAMGVGGLSMFANNVPIGSHEPAAGPWKYRTDETIAHSVFDVRLVEQREAYYVGFWTSWWQQNQSALTP